MSDTKLKISDPHRVPVTFINSVVNQGHLNGIINVTLGTFNFTPNDDGAIDPDLMIVSRLRMDFVCAKQLRDALDQVLAQASKQTGETEH